MSSTSLPSTGPIVVGIDGSPESLIALRWALGEAGRTGADVEVVHCWQVKTLRDVAFGTSHELETGSLCMLDNEVKAALRPLASSPTVRTASVHGNAATVLVERSSGASMLVLGTHGKTTLRDVLLGQVATACRKNAHCPIVMVDADGTVTRQEPKARAFAAH